MKMKEFTKVIIEHEKMTGKVVSKIQVDEKDNVISVEYYDPLDIVRTRLLTPTTNKTKNQETT